MKNSKNKRTMILAAILAGLLVVGYKIMFMSSNEDILIDPTDSSLMVGEKISKILEEVESIDFDTSVTEDPKFKSLRSIETPLISLPVGKINPFSANFGSN
ncbi:MAG: hypothetical protein AAB350_02490 [Patescibacteria group bacterium]|mgnify:CR=1 FL=1